MSDNIPFEVQQEIMKRLPVKSLIQFRSVSKPWKSLIDSPTFIADYQHTKLHQHILVRDDFEQNYVSVADDDTFPHQKVSLTVPMSVKQLYNPILLGSSQGLFCLYAFFGKDKLTYSGTKTAVIWNPTIRKSIDIFVPNLLDIKNEDDTFVGFGVCPRSLDPILVNITMEYSSEGINFMSRTTWRVEVFRLSSGGWKSLSINLPRSTTALHDEDDQVAIDRYIYWGAYDTTKGGSNMILSFDMISEEFTEIHFPHNLACILGMGLHICKLKESLAVLQFDSEVDAPDYHVWMMENGDKKTFSKIYTIMINTLEAPLEGVFGSRKSGEPIIAITNQSGEEEEYELCEYEPNSGQVNHIGISAERSSFFVSSYAETLLLLDY